MTQQTGGMTHISRYAPFPAQVEADLIRQVDAGIYSEWLLVHGVDHPRASRAELSLIRVRGQRAWKVLYESQLPLVAAMAREWTRRSGLPFEEFLQDGAVALGEGLRRFDPHRGVRLATYLWSQVMPVMAQSAARRCGQLDCSLNAAKTVLLVNKTWRRLEADRQREVTRREVADELGWSVRRVNTSLLVCDRQEWDETRLAAGADQDDEPAALLGRAVAGLGGLERRVIAARYGIGCPPASQSEVAVSLSMSPSTVGRIERRALAQMRRRMTRAMAA